MEHIIKRHIRPVKSGKSYFLSQDAKYVSYLVTRTISNPDQYFHTEVVKVKR